MVLNVLTRAKVTILKIVRQGKKNTVEVNRLHVLLCFPALSFRSISLIYCSAVVLSFLLLGAISTQKKRKVFCPFAVCVTFSKLVTFRNHEAELYSLVGIVQDFRMGGRWFDPRAQPVFFSRTDDSYCDRIHSSLTAARCCDDFHVGKQPAVWKESWSEFW